MMSSRSISEGEAVAFIHAPDCEPWASFLQKKLLSDQYNIHSYLHDPNQKYIPELFTSSQTCAVLVSPSLLEEAYEAFWMGCADRFNQRTLILFLGVNREDMRNTLGTALCDCVLAHHWLEVDGSKEAVASALIKLIEVYESSDTSSLQRLPEENEGGDFDDENDSTGGGLYDYPPPPRQHNSVVRVTPSVLYEQDRREVLVLMERQADRVLTLVTESSCGPSQNIELQHITSSAYLATLPGDLAGKVNFMVLSGEHNLGCGSVHIHSRMELVRSLLLKETSPLKLLCSAMGVTGVRSSETEELDSLLGRRLAVSQFPSGLMSLLRSEDQGTAAEQEQSYWPTLLHFAAEFNLMQVCEELLRYPGMIHAACRENCEGLFPCQVAEKNGFNALQKRLVQYVEDMRLRRSVADSGISISENLPAPSPHSSQSHVYANDEATCDDDYVDMGGLSPSCRGILSACLEGSETVLNGAESHTLAPAPAPCKRAQHDGYAKPRSYSEGCVKTPYTKAPVEDRIFEEDDDEMEENGPPSLKSKVGRTQSAGVDYVSHTPVPVRRPDSSSSDSSDSIENKPENTSRSSTETLTHSESGATSGSERKSSSPEKVVFTLESQSDSRPSSQASSHSSEYETPVKPESAPADDTPVLRSKETKRSKSVQDKISHFFKKMKSRRQHSASEGDLPKGQKKTVVYSRQSTASSSSDPSDYHSIDNRTRLSSVSRDSGRDSAMCDDQGSPVLMRSRPKEEGTPRNSGKRNGLSMQRRVSIRVQRARNEDLSETPTLPGRGSSRETFVSFIK